MDRELRIVLTKYFIIVALTILYIAFMLAVVGPAINHVAFGQEVKTTTAPPPIKPTPVQEVTPTSPQPNPQYLPQKAYVQLFAPEVGIPSSSPTLPVISPVVPQAVPVQQTAGIGGVDMGTLMGVLGTLSAAGAYLKGHLANKKADKAEDTSKENAAMNVKQAIVQEESLKLQYENMGTEKSNAITDKPEIRLTELAKMKDKTVETATKS